jgi:NAD(P)-dependent dehydrogenase (short-subunit alcohol dehydrogenase family)
MGKVQGKIAVVTGAAQGIGAVYARALAAEGARVVIGDVLDTAAVVDSIRADGGEALGLRCDVSDTNSVEDMIAETRRSFGGVDILINNAAIFASLKLKPFTDISDAEWEAVMSVNVGGIFRCSRAVIPGMRKQKSGKIINISSGTIFMGAQLLLHYVTSKAAIVGFTRSLAREVGADNICVNALAPGFTTSEGVIGNEGYTEEVREFVAGMRCLPRQQEPADLVGALLFLASSESNFMTGQTMLVDGGHYMH